MEKYQHIIKYVGIAAIVLLLIGLLGWYFFLRDQQGDIAALDAARGFDIAVPSFTGTRSSTSENIAAGLGDQSLPFTPQTNQKPPRLFRVSQVPVAGAAFLSNSMLRYVERSTGYVYDVDPSTGASARRTNTLIPKIYDANILSDGVVLLHTLNDDGIRLSMFGRVSTTTSEEGLAELEVVELGSSIRALVASPTHPDILLIAARADGSAGLTRSTSAGDDPRIIAELPFGGFLPLWLADDRVFVSERPASGVLGSMFQVSGGALVPLLRNIPGLVALPRATSTAMLFSSDDGERLRFFVRPATDTSAIELALQTSAAKCVWAPTASGATSSPAIAYCAASQTPPPTQFTDKWLRGLIHTEDAWFKLDATAGRADRFFVPETSVAIDVEQPTIDMKGEYITFVNARDKSLWILRINEN